MNSMSDELILIDSNLLSYVFDGSEPEKRKICNELVAMVFIKISII